MYTRCKNVCADSVRGGLLSLRCEHGELFESCIVEGCAEIWQLYQDAVQEKRGEFSGQVYRRNARNNRGERKSEYDVAIEKYSVSKYQDDQRKPEEILENQSKREVSRKLFRNIFADEMTLRAALQYRVLKLSQVCLIKAYLDSDDELPNYKRFDAIGRRLGISGKTAERRFQYLVGKFLKTNAETCDESETRVIKVRGERRPRYYRRRSVQFGEWRRDMYELITDRQTISQIRREPAPVPPTRKTYTLSSPVDGLFAALISQLSSDCQGELVLPEEVSASDWELNVSWAELVLAGKKGLTGPWSRSEIAKRLARGAIRCGTCGTYLILGFWIGGRKITRAKEFCNKACLMKAQRQKKRLDTSPGSLAFGGK